MTDYQIDEKKVGGQMTHRLARMARVHGSVVSDKVLRSLGRPAIGRLTKLGALTEVDFPAKMPDIATVGGQTVAMVADPPKQKRGRKNAAKKSAAKSD